jgi:peptidyl-tRNA hydrolase, PTH1 family
MNFWRRLFGRQMELVDEFNEMNDAERFLIVGLGNPGRKYRGNRHNIGFMAVDALAAAYKIESSKVQNKAIVGNGRIQSQNVILAKPQTYMNSSGDAVGPLARFYKVPPENVLVVYDELDLPFGTIRLREKGGAGGHNGMKSIINHLGQDFPRVRLGIGRPPGQMPVPAYVLQDFGKDDLPLLDDVLAEAIRAIEAYLRDGIQLAMSRHNKNLIDD